MNLRLRFSLGLLIFAGLVILTGIASLQTFDSLRVNVNRAIQENGPRMQILGHLQAATARMVTEATSFALFSGAAMRDQEIQEFEEAHDALQRWLAEYRTNAEPRDDRDLTGAVQRVYERSLALIDLSRENASDTAILEAAEALKATEDGLFRLLARLVDREISMIQSVNWSVSGIIDWSDFLTHARIAVVILVSVALLAALQWQIVKPITVLKRAAEQMAQGNYSYRADLRPGDELGDLASAFNSMAQALEKRDRELVTLNQSLEQSVRERTADLEALHRVSLQLTSSLSLPTVFEAVLTQAGQLLAADDANIFLFDGENLRFGASLWDGKTQPRPRIAPRKHGFTYLVATRGETIIIEDMRTNTISRQRGVDGAAIGLPLLTDGVVRGVMTVIFLKPRTFSPHEVYLLELLADHAAMAIQNAQLYEQVQRSVTELEERVAERTAELQEALGKERRLNELKSRFVATVSHEFRTPLAIIQAGGDLLQRYSDRMSDSQKREQIDEIHRQVKHLTELLDDILTVSKAETVGLDFDPDWCDPVSLAESVIADLHPLAHEHVVDFQAEAGCPRAWLDTKLVRRALYNLLSNAIKYSDAGSTICVRVGCENRTITFSVRDEGIGIPEEDQKELFGLFHRGSNVGGIAGTGLGLSIVKHAVQAHRGHIEVESEVGVGSVFTLRLPVEKVPVFQESPDTYESIRPS